MNSYECSVSLLEGIVCETQCHSNGFPSALTWVPFEMVAATVFVACVLAVVSTAASGSEAVPVWNLI
jgi:hypothetical protein